jgi:quercetin dioxygenase-like cupin family protein
MIKADNSVRSSPRKFFRIMEGGDAKALLERIHPQMWREQTLRQDYEGSAHADTETIFLRAPLSTVDVLNVIDSVTLPAWDVLGMSDFLEPVKTRIGARELGRVMLVKLKPRGFIRPHRDEGAYARYFARFHIVLSGHCVFYCGGEEQAMAPGELWWFNHQKDHEVHNGEQERIHLILDACAPGYTGALA